jgi:hypothetical protein
MTKTKEEILKMSKSELLDYKWSNDLDSKKENSNCSHCFDCSYCSNCSICSDCFDCSDCSNCFDCSDCSHCSNCSYCRNLKDKRNGYWICNVKVTKEEYEEKMKELGGEKK